MGSTPTNITALLGDTLLNGKDTTSTADALAGKKAVALYFSAHWCPPCRGFTPQLATWYTDDLKAAGLEIIFCSSDRDEAAFQEYYAEMPWLSLPYENRELKEQLSKKFKVQGIPSVVILDPTTGDLITADGRAALSGDPTGVEMPWKPPTLAEVTAGAMVVNKEGVEVALEEATRGKTVAYYFSAHWCPPCKGFTPQLAEWYTKDLQTKGLEVIFVSSDRDEGAFKEYHAAMPWPALTYTDRKRKDQLNTLFGVSGIPSLAIVGADGEIINKDGRGAVSADPTGAEFPWHPKPVNNLKAGPGEINETTTMIAFCEGASLEAQQAVEAALTPIAEGYIAEGKAKGEDLKMAFLMVTESEDLAGRVRGMMEMGSPEEDARCRLMIMDIPDNGGWYAGPWGDITTEAAQAVVDDYNGKKLERKQLQ